MFLISGENKGFRRKILLKTSLILGISLVILGTVWVGCLAFLFSTLWCLLLSGENSSPEPRGSSSSSSLDEGESPAGKEDIHEVAAEKEVESELVMTRRQRKRRRRKLIRSKKAMRSTEEETSEEVGRSLSSPPPPPPPRCGSLCSSDSGVCSGNNKEEEEEEEEEEEISFLPVPPPYRKGCKQYQKLGLTETDVYFTLLNYLLSPEQLAGLGYPAESRTMSSKHSLARTSVLNIAAKEFVPSRNLDLKICVRCSTEFDKKDYEESGSRRKKKKRCLYHHGKLRLSRDYTGGAFSCCGGSPQSWGCESASHHVWIDSSPSTKGYVKTRSVPALSSSSFGVFSLDCEMAFTTSGMELVKVAVISVDGTPVYESFVQPESPIIDHNTRFSGVTAEDLKNNPTKTLKRVQKDLLALISSESVLIGHALDNDFRALKFIHEKVVDTAVLFPHYYGIPYRRSLKSLTECYLKRRIQTGQTGHDPYEDALASVELILWKMRKDLDDGVPIIV